MRESVHIWHVCSLWQGLSDGNINFELVTFIVTFDLLLKNFNICHNFLKYDIKLSYLACLFLCWSLSNGTINLDGVTLTMTFDLLLKKINIAPANLHIAMWGPSWLCQYSSLFFIWKSLLPMQSSPRVRTVDLATAWKCTKNMNYEELGFYYTQIINFSMGL